MLFTLYTENKHVFKVIPFKYLPHFPFLQGNLFCLFYRRIILPIVVSARFCAPATLVMKHPSTLPARSAFISPKTGRRLRRVTHLKMSVVFSSSQGGAAPPSPESKKSYIIRAAARAHAGGKVRSLNDNVASTDGLRWRPLSDIDASCGGRFDAMVGGYAIKRDTTVASSVTTTIVQPLALQRQNRNLAGCRCCRRCGDMPHWRKYIRLHRCGHAAGQGCCSTGAGRRSRRLSGWKTSIHVGALKYSLHHTYNRRTRKCYRWGNHLPDFWISLALCVFFPVIADAVRHRPLAHIFHSITEPARSDVYWRSPGPVPLLAHGRCASSRFR